jgi:hypothetical protein
MDGERTIAAKTRPRKRPRHSRSTAEVAPTAPEMPTAEMPTAMAATVKMPSTAVTSTVATSTVAPAAMTAAAMTAAAAAFRSSIARGRQRGRKNKDGNSNLEF